MQDLEMRQGLPEALRVLVEQYPRDIWQSHRNFDGLTRFWLERHMMFRDLLVRIQGQTRQFVDHEAEPQRFARQTAHLTGFLLNQLHGHHQVEDIQYFPLLSSLEPRLQPGFELLDADHHALDGFLHSLADGTNDLLENIRNGRPEAHTAAGRLEADLGRFALFLDRHLIDEEDLVIPTILHHAPRF